MKVEIECDRCKKKILRYPSQIKCHNFCSRLCLAEYSNKEKNPDGYASLKDLTGVSKHMSELNKELNPTRMSEQTRIKLRDKRLGRGNGKGYGKVLGQAEHRVVAEKILKRPLRVGEVVHHIDFNKRNNEPWNLMIFPSQKEHARYHAVLQRFFDTGEIIGAEIKEVMPNEVHSS